MNKKVLLFLCSILMIAALSSCNEDNFLGIAVQPQDRLLVGYDTISVKTKTVFVDSIFLRSSVAALGEFTDPTYGTTKSDFMAQLYCAREFHFPDDVKQIDSAFIVMNYNQWFGDSTNVNHVSVYQLDKTLNLNESYYSNADVNKYCYTKNLIAQGSFIPGDVYSTDSVRNLSLYQPKIKLPIKKALCDSIFKISKRNPEKFRTPEAFQEFFKGIYVTTDFGNGSIVYITDTKLEFCFDTWLKNNTDGYRDSLVVGAAYFPITKEVKQVNRTSHVDLPNELQSPNDSLNYIYAPAGMFTEVTIPDTLFTKKSGILSGKTVSSLRLQVMATQLESGDYSMAPPTTLLLLNKDAEKSFFKGYELNDGVNSFLAIYDPAKEQYIFNLTAYAQKMVHKMNGSGDVADFKPFTNMIMVPVSVFQSDKVDTRIDHLLTPSAVKVRGGNHPVQPMKLEVLYTKPE